MAHRRSTCSANRFTVRKITLLVGLLLFLVKVPDSLQAAPQIELPAASTDAAIIVRAASARRWKQGVYDVWQLNGHCSIQQDTLTASGSDAVLWIENDQQEGQTTTRVLIYLEGRQKGVDVRSVKQGNSDAAGRITGTSWMGRLESKHGIQIQANAAAPGQLKTVRSPATISPVQPAVFEDFNPDTPLHPQATRRNAPVQHVGEVPLDSSDNAIQPAQALSVPAAPEPSTAEDLQIRINPRSSAGFNVSTAGVAEQGDSIAYVTGGIQMVIDGLDAQTTGVRDPNLARLGRVVIETDNLVAWTPQAAALFQGGASRRARQLPLELYLEGNIVFRQGDRVIYAKRMYYDVSREHGVVLEAEILTPVPQYEGLLRLKGEVLRMVDRNHFQAYGAAVTSSRMGVPSYWLQSDEVTFEDIPEPIVEPLSGQPETDPVTGETRVNHQLRTRSFNNFVYLNGIPVLYWPVLSTDLTKPTFYINNLQVTNDNVFGTQVQAQLDPYQLLGISNPPEGTEWSWNASYLSERGFGFGTELSYENEDLWGIPGTYRGTLDTWGLNDNGLDNLGADRRAVQPESDYRGRLSWQHRQQLPNDLQWTAEIGLISDRNFLEQYFEPQWDQEKDLTTGMELKQTVENGSWSLSADVQLNDFFTQTETLPRGDHFSLGRSVLFDRATWYEHTHAGYFGIKTAALPTNPDQPAQAFLPWETDLTGTEYRERSGLRVASRQELDLPFQWGAVKVVPFLGGEISHWQQDRNGEEVTRLLGQAGVRTSLPIWKANPSIQDPLFNLQGLIHKVSFDSEFFWADASEDMSQLPLYDPLDDDSNEMFQRMFLMDSHAGALPARFDPRFMALRSGAQRWVTGPTEIADDLFVIQANIRQRWQTRRGLTGRERIVDWISMDTGFTLFPKPDRDNFGQEIGLAHYDFRWHLGDRTTLLSDGYIDFFGSGLRKFTAGGVISRPGQGNLFLGLRSIEGPISSTVLIGTTSYRMSDKWILSAGGAVDLGPTGNIGQTLAFTRIGESFLVKAGFRADVSRGNVGAVFVIEPRFLPTSRLGRIAGLQVPPAGAYGLE